MQQLVNAKSKVFQGSAAYGLSAILATNMVVLFALDSLRAIPAWLKNAVNLFLLF